MPDAIDQGLADDQKDGGAVGEDAFEELNEVIPPRLGRDFAVELAEKRLDAVLFCFQDVMVFYAVGG